MNIYMIRTLWTPFQAERDWKNLYRETLLIPLYIFYSLWPKYFSEKKDFEKKSYNLALKKSFGKKSYPFWESKTLFPVTFFSRDLRKIRLFPEVFIYQKLLGSMYIKLREYCSVQNVHTTYLPASRTIQIRSLLKQIQQLQ